MKKRYVILSLILLVITMFSNIYVGNRLAEAAKRSVVEREELLTQISKLISYQSQLLDAETGQRGYIITGDTEFLQPFESASIYLSSPQTNFFLDSLKSDPLIKDRILQVESWADQKMQRLREIINVRKTQGFDAAAKIVEQKTGKRLMDEIRVNIASILKDKKNEVLQSDAVFQETLDRIIITAVSFNFIVILFVIPIVIFLHFFLKKKLVLIADLKKNNAIYLNSLQLLPYLTLGVDIQFHFILSTPSVFTVLGYTQQELIDKPLSTVLRREENEAKLKELSQKFGKMFEEPLDVIRYVKQMEFEEHIEWNLRKKSEETIKMSISCKVIQDASQHAIGYLLIAKQ